jgi:O-antigen/teichoic acid export membrane protein
MFQLMRQKIYSLLRWSEKYTRTDMVYFAKGGGWLMLGKIIGMMATFALSVLFANLLPKETYGNYRFVVSVIGIFSLSTLSSMGVSITRAVAQGNEGSLKPAISAEIKWGILGCLGSLGLAAYYLVIGNVPFATAFVVVAFFMPFFNVFNLYASILTGKKIFNLAVKYDIYTQIINFGIMVPFLIFVRDIWALIIPFLIMNTLVQYIFLRRTMMRVPLNDKVDPAAVTYGKYLSLMDVASMVAATADQLLIFYFLGPVQLAIYNMALAPTEQLKGVFKLVGQLAFPKFAEQSKEALGKAIFNKVFIFTLAMLPIVAAYVIAAPWLFKLLFPAYASSVIYTQVLCVSLLFTGSMLFMQYLQAHSMSDALYKYNVLNILLEIGVVFLLLYFYGLWGAVIAKVISRGVVLLALAIFSRSRS